MNTDAEYLYNDEVIQLEQETIKKQESKMVQFNKQLIQIVKLYPMLYDRNCRKGSKRKGREKCWNLVAKQLNKGVDFCKMKWSRLRITLSRMMVIHQDKIWSGERKSCTKPPWKYYDDLKYLVPYTLHYKRNKQRIEVMKCKKVDERSDKETIETIEIDDEEDESQRKTLTNCIVEPKYNNFDETKIEGLKGNIEMSLLKADNIIEDSTVEIEKVNRILPGQAIKEETDNECEIVDNTFGAQNTHKNQEQEISNSCNKNTSGNASKQNGDCVNTRNFWDRHKARDEKLLNIVKENTILYTFDGREVYTRAERRKAWNHVSSQMGLESEYCKLRWYLLKKKFLEVIKSPTLFKDRRKIEDRVAKTKWILEMCRFYAPYTNIIDCDKRIEKILKSLEKERREERGGSCSESEVEEKESEEMESTWSDHEAEDFVLKSFITNVLKQTETRQKNRQSVDVEDELSCYTNFFT